MAEGERDSALREMAANRGLKLVRSRLRTPGKGDYERRRGVGRALVEAACERLGAKGCGLIEVTSNADLSGAHAFYRKLGFERTSYRFAMSLD